MTTAIMLGLAVFAGADPVLAETDRHAWVRYSARIEATASMLFASARQTPAVFFSLMFLATVPVLVISGVIMRAALRAREETGSTANSSEMDIAHPPPAAIFLLSDNRKFKISGHAQRIGREADNEIRILHPTVHRYHAIIERDDCDGVTITDLSGLAGNGVYVNGKRVQHASLKSGDSIAIGAAVLGFTTTPHTTNTCPTLAERLAD